MGRTGTPRTRRLRHSRFVRTQRRDTLQDFLDAQATRLAASATGQAFTAANATERLTITGHGISEGEGPYLVSNSGGALPDGLSASTLYYVIVVDANTLQLAHSPGGDPVGFTDDGTGTHTLTKAVTDEALFEIMRRNRPETIGSIADVDDLA
jgi:hypothetical protein